MPQTAEQLRAAAMALLAQAEQIEQPEPEQAPVATREDYVSWVMNQAEQVQTLDEAWHLIVDSWDEFDGNETLTLVGALIANLGDPQAEDEAVDDEQDEEYEPEPVEVVSPGQPTPTAMRMFLMTQGYDPAQLVGMDDDQVEAAVGRVMQLPDEPPEANPWPPGTAAHTRFAARLQPKTVHVPSHAAPSPVEEDGERPPRGMRRRRPSDASRIQAAPPAAEFDPDNPFAHLAAQPVQLAEPLKTSAPRKPSGHQIPAHLQQWKKDGAGRRVPINTPEA